MINSNNSDRYSANASFTPNNCLLLERKWFRLYLLPKNCKN